MDKAVERSGMYIVKAEAYQVEKIVDMSIRAFETDVNVCGGRAISITSFLRCKVFGGRTGFRALTMRAKMPFSGSP